MESKQIIIFDGECGFCNRTVLFIAKKDVENEFLLVSNLSKRGQEILNSLGLDKVANETLILVKGNKHSVKGRAIKKIAKEIRISTILLFVLRITPNQLLNLGYSFFSKFRKKIIKNNHCQIPSSDILNKFIL